MLNQPLAIAFAESPVGRWFGFVYYIGIQLNNRFSIKSYRLLLRSLDEILKNE